MPKKNTINIKEKIPYILILTLFFILAIFLNKPFKNENSSYSNFNSKGCSYASNHFVAGTKVKQNFYSVDDNLVKVGIHANTQDKKITSNINVEIKEVESDKVILNQDINLANLSNNSYLIINLEKQENSKNKEYEITITSIDGTPENSILLWQAPNDESTGEIYEINDVQDENNKLMIKTTYLSGTIKIVNIATWIGIYILSLIFIIFFMGKADEKTFLKFTICFSIIYIFINPFFHPYDENNHFFRALLISQGNFYDELNENKEIGGYVPTNYLDFVSTPITIKTLLTDKSPLENSFNEERYFMSNIYFSSTVPTGHFLPAIGIFIGNLINLNGIFTIYLGRLMTYVFYIVCSYLSIKNLKYYKSTMFIIATLPIALYLAGSVHLDPIISGSCFLFISICLKYYFQNDEEGYITKIDIILLIISAIFIITNKYLTFTPLVLLFFLIPRKKFKTKKAYTLMIVASVIIGILCVLWQFYLLDMFPYVEDRNGNVNQKEQIQFILENPIYAARVLLNEFLKASNMQQSRFTYIDSISVIGNLTGILVVFGAILDKNKFNSNIKKKNIISIILAIFYIITLFISILALYLSFTPVGQSYVEGYQIRYSTPILILFMIPIANCFNIKNEMKNYEKNIVFFMLIVNLNLILAIVNNIFTA